MSSNADGYVESKPMNAMSDVSTVNRYVRSLEKSEARRCGVKESKARVNIASRIGVSPGTLENFRRLRTKIVPSWLMNRIRSELIAVLQSEIQRLEHEVHLARQTGIDHRDDDLQAAEAQVAAAKEILRSAR